MRPPRGVTAPGTEGRPRAQGVTLSVAEAPGAPTAAGIIMAGDARTFDVLNA